MFQVKKLKTWSDKWMKQGSNFFPLIPICFSKYMFQVKKLKTWSDKWMKQWSNFSPLIPISWCDKLNERVNKLTRRKSYLGQNVLCVNVRRFEH